MATVENNLTSGNVFKTLWKFTIPFIGINLIQTLYGMVDLYIVGQFAATADVSAVSVAGTVIATFSMLLVGLSIGTTVVVGQRFGAGDKKALEAISATAFSLAGIVGVVLAVAVGALSVPLLRWINTPEDAMGGAIAYMLICSVGYIFQSFYNMLAGILRGVGDSKTPLLFVGVSSILNVIGDVILVWGFGMGAAGAAIATTVSQGICILMGVVHVTKRGFPFDFKLRSYRFDRQEARELIGVGMPIALQEVLVMFSFIILEGIVNRFGLSASAAAGILDKIFLLATIPTNAFCSSISAMVAQNVGAGAHKRAVECLWYGCILSVAFAVVFFLLGWLIPEKMVGIFTADQEVIAAGTEYYVGYKYEYILCALAFCVNGFINGTGHTKLTLANNIISTYAVRIPGCVLLGVALGWGILGIGYALPAASAVQALVGFAFFALGKWKNPPEKERRKA